ncbi:exported hypothetical protein [Magnetospirillum sp. SS-4]|jgi:hypothetical protein|nr:hypothetical protein [Magnetospirillum sp. SS-4]CAA7625459.1 exported hypothetical protein [Magnetospirillum sp. SS-4]
MKTKSRIGARLGLGFGVCLLFTLIVGVVGMRGNVELSNLTADLHAHPLTVTHRTDGMFSAPPSAWWGPW